VSGWVSQWKSPKKMPPSPRAAAQNSGNPAYEAMRRSRSSFPCSTSRSATVAEIGLVTDAMLNGVFSVTGVRASTSA
jgi:hypothetical protein